MMDIKKEREAYEAWASKNIENFIDAVFDGKYYVMRENSRLKQKDKEFLILSLNRGFSAWIERAKAQVPEWISTNAKEPPLGTMVLICWADTPDVEPEKDYMDHDVDHGVNYWANYNGGDEPSHWMPLPNSTQDQAHD